jgi:hypothetical protein
VSHFSPNKKPNFSGRGLLEKHLDGVTPISRPLKLGLVNNFFSPRYWHKTQGFQSGGPVGHCKDKLLLQTLQHSQQFFFYEKQGFVLRLRKFRFWINAN